MIQNGAVVWEKGLGRQDVDGNVLASPDTPYYIGDVSQTMGAALAIRKCYEQDSLELSDRVTRWVPNYPDENATVAHLLTHTTNAGSFQYSLDRFAGLTDIIVECADQPYRHVLYNEVFNRFGMGGSVPGPAFTGTASPGAMQFDSAVITSIRRRVAQSRGPVQAGSGSRGPLRYRQPSLTAATGVVSTVRDLATFDIALGSGSIIARRAWRRRGRRPSLRATPFRPGWAGSSRNYKGEPLIWQFGLIRDGHSALVLKLPLRNLTFIALANSDAMTAGYNLNNGDVKASPFAKLFLDFFAP